MICILIAGIPASGKSTFAEYLADRLSLPMMSKDRIKELLFDTVGFHSRTEKVALGNASFIVLCAFAETMMRSRRPFILENNFETSSKPELERLLSQYSYTPLTVRFTGDLSTIYKRYAERNRSLDRHPGHVINTCYPPEDRGMSLPPPPSFEQFVQGVRERGMLDFSVGGTCIEVDATDFSRVDYAALAGRIRSFVSINKG